MDNDLISRETLLKAMEEERQYLLRRGQAGAEHILVHHCLPLIDNAPTVLHNNYSMGYQDGVKKVLSEKRPTGHWINEHSIDIGYKTAECSECGERSRLIRHDTGFGYDYEYYPFCHWCGADMRKETSNE